MIRYFVYAVVFGTAAICWSQSRADILFSDTFSYPNGNLVGNNLWAAHSGAGSMPVQVNNGTIVLEQGSGSREDVNRPLGVSIGATDIWRFEFDVTVTEPTNADATNVYFAHFAATATTFNTRVYVAAPNTAGGNFTFGISQTIGTAPDVTFATDFAYGTTYRLFAEYNRNTQLASLWVNDPGNGVITSTTSSTLAVTWMAFRQATGSTTIQTVDNLVVSAVPEPSVIGLLGLAMISGTLVRRRKS
jgi:hypothetical protein